MTFQWHRIKRLEREGIIKKYVALVEAEKVEKGLIFFCDITLKEHTKEIDHQFVIDITASKYVCECYNISGEYNFRLKVMVKDIKHYQDFVFNDLGSIKTLEMPKIHLRV
ncbi:Lrp/AsnC family transcriptional regulator [Zunongwangia pacifica]|uniref:Lrp/AsnC family transcriptional regulator n=1 Tax=Zunongwangia pacifica TaxID=2911062 RepID=A0A9X1ZQA1_9FLAO|nr:Lrp/AsnC family transcriptional regulator [Zunongwangia pacifica]MCL6218977.1 Lrp/AsnC family transcriptional regulator [Zunongwangia pacifica]